ncbi:MAG: acyloxyacyl hydrolase [Desulfobacterales bacterium]|nr:acyloxyacyl hydrolase [Desulfobacterales bacterium]
MKRAVLVLICLAFLWGNAWAEESAGFGVTLGYGQSQDNIDIYRVGLAKKWNVKWLKNKTGYVDGYFELSYNHWNGDNDEINAFALSPVFVYAFNPSEKNWYPYIEGGIGVAYLDEYKIDSRDLSSNFQFEDRIGAGIRYDNLDFNFRYMHYSNASLEDPNHGIDIWIGTLAWYF